MSLMSGSQKTSKHMPVVEVMRRILKRQQGPITVKELTAQIVDSWGRDFPVNPYEECCLVYKLAVGILHCQENFDNLATGGPLYIERDQKESDPILLSPRMSSQLLNPLAEQIAQIKLFYRDNLA